MNRTPILVTVALLVASCGGGSGIAPPDGATDVLVQDGAPDAIDTGIDVPNPVGSPSPTAVTTTGGGGNASSPNYQVLIGVGVPSSFSASSNRKLKMGPVSRPFSEGP